MVEVAAVVESLDQAGKTFKVSKCTFGAQSIEYLGHHLGPDGVRPLQGLVTAVEQFPQPEDSVAVKRFVHLAVNYRRFVPHFGALAAPLTKLLRQDVAWRWGDEESHAFDTLKRAIVTKPVLKYPDFARPFVLNTNASKVGLGAELMQEHDGRMLPMAYASSVNSKAESNYSVTELERLAVIWSVKLSRPYPYGRSFKILTDHNALRWLMKSRDIVGGLHRWALAKQKYDFTVQYRPGHDNVVADAMS